MPPEYLRRITSQVSDTPWLLSVANNHAGDNGANGVKETLKTLQTFENITPIGDRLSDDAPPAVTLTVDDLRHAGGGRVDDLDGEGVVVRIAVVGRQASRVSTPSNTSNTSTRTINP